MPQSLHFKPTHIVFSTKNRHRWITDAIRPELWAYLAKCLQNLRCNDILIGGVADHVHIYCNFTKHHSIIHVLQVIKQDSSRWIKTKGTEHSEFHWQDGYGCFGIGPNHVDALKAYIRNQEEHHRQESFQDEYRRLLKKYAIEIDERYVWD